MATEFLHWARQREIYRLQQLTRTELNAKLDQILARSALSTDTPTTMEPTRAWDKWLGVALTAIRLITYAGPLIMLILTALWKLLRPFIARLLLG